MEHLLYQCSVLVTQYDSFFITALLVGLFGGLTHCTGMCGPFAATQSWNMLQRTPATTMQESLRVKATLLAPYHLGRISTYILLGVISSQLGAFIFSLGSHRVIASTILFLTGVILIASVAPSSLRHLFNWAIPTPVINKISRATLPLFTNPTGFRGYALGLMLGFIPCGMIYAMLLFVTTLHNPWAAGVAMATFGLATAPALMLVSGTSSLLIQRWKDKLRILAKSLMAINGIHLWILAGKLWV